MSDDRDGRPRRPAHVPPRKFAVDELVLVAAAEEHADDLFRTYTGDPEASRFLLRAPHADVEATLRVIDAWGAASWGSDGRYAWVIIDHEVGRPVGLIFLELAAPRGEIHFGISRARQGRGLATAACRTITRWVDTCTDIVGLATTCHPENLASRRVLEKVGFELKARDVPMDHRNGTTSVQDRLMRARDGGQTA